jgi:hypothetical protein
MTAFAVDPYLNDPKHDDPGCLAPAPSPLISKPACDYVNNARNERPECPVGATHGL